MSEPARHDERDGRGDHVLALDTATTRVVVALGGLDGREIARSAWPAEHRHGEHLLASIRRILDESGVARSGLRGVVVGTGPGAFTGLRVGLAAAKAMAHGLGIPLVGVPTSDALIAAAARTLDLPAERLVLLLPAGPNDRVACRLRAAPRLLPRGVEPDLGDRDRLVAVDLAGRADAASVVAGASALDGLGPELLRAGAARLAAGDADDLARLVPEYVTLPRGVAALTGEVAWSRDPR
jgi:tRNA threonylcarbamoyladenosine biosynthesis protein TsaB